MRNCARVHRLFASSVVMMAVTATVAYGHTYFGLQHRTLVRARVQSPTASTADFPIPIGDSSSLACFAVRNTGLFDSRITAIGFELPGELTGFSLVSASSSGFHLIGPVEHVPELPDVTLDFALVTGRTFGGGYPHGGLAPDDPLTTFCVRGPFDPTVPIERMLDRGVLRVQRVGADGELGDVAVWENRLP